MKNHPEYGIGAAAVPYSPDLPTYLRITDIDEDGRFIPVNKASLVADNYQDYILNPGELVFARTGATVGKCYLYDVKDGQLVYAGFLIKVAPDEEKLLPTFLRHFTDSVQYTNWVKTNSTRSGQPGLNGKEYASMPIPTPPIAEQKRIADLLDTWDEAIALQTRQLQQLRRRKEGLYNDLFSGSSRLPGFSQLRKQSTLGAYFAERVERGNTELPLLAITANQGIVHRDNLEKRDTSNEDKSKYKRVRVGDIGYNTMRMWQGVSALSKFDGIVSPAYTILRPLDNCDAGFMSHFFKWTPMIHRFWRHSQGLVDDTLLCKYDSFKTIPAEVPELAEQRAIAEVLNTAEAEIRLTERKLDALRAQKRGLLQQLLTGEILLS